MPVVGATAGHHHDLRAGGTIKVSCLSGGVDLEFLDAFDRGGHHAGSHTVGLAATDTGKVVDITDRVTGHVVGVVAAINGERVLIHERAGNVASGCHTRLQRH